MAAQSFLGAAERRDQLAANGRGYTRLDVFSTTRNQVLQSGSEQSKHNEDGASAPKDD